MSATGDGLPKGNQDETDEALNRRLEKEAGEIRADRERHSDLLADRGKTDIGAKSTNMPDPGQLMGKTVVTEKLKFKTIGGGVCMVKKTTNTEHFGIG